MTNGISKRKSHFGFFGCFVSRTIGHFFLAKENAYQTGEGAFYAFSVMPKRDLNPNVIVGRVLCLRRITHWQ